MCAHKWCPSFRLQGIEVTVFAFALIYLREQGTREFVVGVFSSTADIPVLFRVAFGVLADSYDFGGAVRPFRVSCFILV